jgi:molecular chaperone DnaK
LAEQFLQQEGIDLRKERQSLQRLTEAAEKAKIELSGTPVTEINLPFITATPEGPKHLETRLQRSQFEEMCGDLFSQLRSPVKRALADAGLRPTQIDEIVLVGGSTRIPAVRELVEELLDLRPSQNVNPEEVVAIGAAIQAGILSGEIKNVLLLDVTPLSFGLETIGGLMKKLIPRNTTIPVRRTDIFSTAENNQTAVEVHIVQGERDMAQANKSLGRLRLTGIPPAPKGIPQIQVAFDIDANGILQVSAVDRTTGREQVVTIQGAANLNESEVQRMVKEAEQFSKSDRAKRDKIERRNKAEALTYQAERQLREVALEYGLQFASGQRRHIEELVGDLRAALTENNERDTDDFRLELESAIADFNRQVRLLAESEDEGFFSTLKKTLLGDDDEEFYDYRRGSDFNNPYGGNNYGYGNYNPSPYSDYRPDFKAPRRDFDAEVWDEPRRQPNRDENRGNFKDNPPPRRQSPASRDNFDDDRSRRQPNRDDFNDNPPPRRQSSPTRDNFDDDRSRRQPNRDNFNDNPPPRRQSPANRDNFDDDRSRRQPNRDNFNDNPPPRRQSSPNRDNNPPPRRQSPANRDDFDGNPPRRQPNRDDRQRPADIWDDDDW